MSDKAIKKICFVLPEYSRKPGGGTKVVFEYANILAAEGCKVTICFWPRTSLKQYHMPEFVRRMLCRVFTAVFPKWFPLDQSIKKRCIFSISDSTIPEGTDIVATAVETAKPVAQLSPEKGNKHYLIQGFEIWNTPELEVRSTYRMGMSNIVVSDWLAELVRSEASAEPNLIKDWIDEDTFYPEHDVTRHKNEVAILYHVDKHKGFCDLFEALQTVKADYPELIVNAFGTPPRPNWFPDWIRYAQAATPEQLREIYSRSLVFACATINEGFGLTLPESMFCGCALASTKFRGVWEYANEDCALLSNVGDPEELAKNILRLLKDSDFANELANKGRQHAMSECSREKAEEAIKKEFGVGALK